MEGQISVFDDQGNKLGTKPKSAIDRKKDIFRIAALLVVSPKGEIWIGKDQHLWKDRFSFSAAVMVEEKEKPSIATARLLKTGFGVHEKVTLLGVRERLYTAGEVKRFMSCYIYNALREIQPTSDGQWIPIRKVKELLNTQQEKFSPLFYAGWKQCVGHL